MNMQEIKNLAAICSVLFGGLFAAHNVTVSTEQWASLITEFSVAVPALVSAFGFIYSVVSHWNKKKVPETSLIATHTDGASMKRVVGALLFVLLMPLSFSHVRAQTDTTSAVLTAAENQIYAALNTIIAFAGGFVQADLNAAIADAQSQTPPNTQAVTCWQTIAKLPVTKIPTGAGLAYLKQKYLDMLALSLPLNSNCGSVAPLFLKQYNQFMSLAAAQNL